MRLLVGFTGCMGAKIRSYEVHFQAWCSYIRQRKKCCESLPIWSRIHSYIGNITCLEIPLFWTIQLSLTRKFTRLHLKGELPKCREKGVNRSDSMGVNKRNQSLLLMKHACIATSYKTIWHISPCCKWMLSIAFSLMILAMYESLPQLWCEG